MSSSLYWEPIINRGNHLSDELKYILRKRWGTSFDLRLMDKDVDYLIGLKHGCEKEKTGKEIDTLLQAIERHDEIRIWDGYM